VTDLFDFGRIEVTRPASYPASPGFKDRQTSREAAGAIEGRAPTLRDRCAGVVRQRGLQGCTADEAAELLGETILSIRPRFTELVRMGLIEDSGERRSNAPGRRAKVMIAENRRTTEGQG